MNTCSMNDTAKNGFSVQTSVELLWEDSEPFAKRPFRVVTMVNGHAMAHSHHQTNLKAKKRAEGMHKAYLQVHGRLAA
jgi:hypothetical protein